MLECGGEDLRELRALLGLLEDDDPIGGECRRSGVRTRAVQGAQTGAGGLGGPLQADEVHKAGDQDHVSRI